MTEQARSKEGELHWPAVRNDTDNSHPVREADTDAVSQRNTIANSSISNPSNPQTSRLSESERTGLLKTIWELSPDILAVKNTRGVYQVINPAFCEWFAVSEGDVVGKTDADLFPGNDGELFLRSDLEAIRLGEPMFCEETRRTAKGLRHYRVSRVPYCKPEGGVLGLLFCLRDITELKQTIARAEQAVESVKKHEQTLQQLIDSMPAGVMLLDSELRLLAWNKTYLTYFDPSLKWCVGARIQDVMPLAEESGIVQKLYRALKTGRPVRVREFKYEGLKKGTTYWRGVAVPLELSLETGSTAALAVMVVDVTREVMAREKYAQTAELARQREREIRELYEHEHSIAIQLQKGLLSHDLPDLRGFEITRRYQAASEGALVGGDFYDIFRISARKVGVVIGDVAGRGLNAAIYTAMTKHMLRAYALENSLPSLVLARLNDALISCTPVEVFVTLIYGVLDAEDGTFTYSNAGHELPVYYSARLSRACSLDLTGRALALLPGYNYSTHVVSFEPEDVLVLYTDGISDAGRGTNRLGREQIVSIVDSIGCHSGNDIANAIMQAALNFAGGHLADDAALLVIRALPRRRTVRS
jgi:sigma-B regulation protein RsbU (phosphoserine phosphatase)